MPPAIIAYILMGGNFGSEAEMNILWTGVFYVSAMAFFWVAFGLLILTTALLQKNEEVMKWADELGPKALNKVFWWAGVSGLISGSLLTLVAWIGYFIGATFLPPFIPL